MQKVYSHCKGHLSWSWQTWKHTRESMDTLRTVFCNSPILYYHIRRPRMLFIVHCLTTSHHKQKACEDGSQLSWLTLVWGRLAGRALLADLAGRSGMLRTLRGWNNNTAPRDDVKQQNVLNYSICFFIFKGLKHDDRRWQRSPSL